MPPIARRLKTLCLSVTLALLLPGCVFITGNLNPSTFGASSTPALPVQDNVRLQSAIAEDWAYQSLPSVRHASIGGSPAKASVEFDITGGTITIPRTARQDVDNRHGDLRERINIHDERTMM